MAEKPLAFPWRSIYKERLRLGIPALFRYLNKKGYDIWVYTAGYYSVDYIQRLFTKYHVQVTSAVTGTGRKTSGSAEYPVFCHGSSGSSGSAEEKKKMETLIAAKYPETVHIDGETVLRIFSRTK